MTLINELRELLKKDTRFVDDKGNLLKNRIVELALKLDRDLIKLLLKNERIKNYFFKDIDGVLVFDKEKFVMFIDNKEFLPDSYTAFKNKIGLANEERKYLAKSKEIVLVWPYKDCVLEGGQEKPNEKRKEIFHNIVLAPDEIDRLFSMLLWVRTSLALWHIFTSSVELFNTIWVRVLNHFQRVDTCFCCSSILYGLGHNKRAFFVNPLSIANFLNLNLYTLSSGRNKAQFNLLVTNG